MKHNVLKIEGMFDHFEISVVEDEDKKCPTYNGKNHKRFVKTENIEIIVNTIIYFLDGQEEE